MPGGELEPLGLSGPNLPGVAAELSEIFAHAGAPGHSPAPRRPASVSALRPERSRGRSLTVLAAAAAGLAGLGAGAFVIRTPAPSPAAQVAQAPAPRTTEPPMVVAQSAPPPIVLTPPASEGRASEAPATETPVIEAPVRPRPKHAAVRRTEPRPRLARVKSSPRHQALPMAQPASCVRDASAPGCRNAVIQADRHLRNVYETAVRRGVSHTVLVDYRDRWADLRERDHEDPVRLIQSYGALAYDLGREARDSQEGAMRRRDASGLRALADAVLPWR